MFVFAEFFRMLLEVICLLHSEAFRTWQEVTNLARLFPSLKALAKYSE